MSWMRREAAEAPDAIARLLAQDGARYAALGARLCDTPPRSILTLVRGSPAHAAHYAGYLLMFAPRGPALPGLLALADDLRQRGAEVLLAALPGTPGASLVLTPAADADLDPIAAIQSFYPLAEALASARGRDPDQPPHLAKVTRTH